MQRHLITRNIGAILTYISSNRQTQHPTKQKLQGILTEWPSANLSPLYQRIPKLNVTKAVQRNSHANSTASFSFSSPSFSWWNQLFAEFPLIWQIITTSPTGPTLGTAIRGRSILKGHRISSHINGVHASPRLAKCKGTNKVFRANISHNSHPQGRHSQESCPIPSSWAFFFPNSDDLVVWWNLISLTN